AEDIRRELPIGLGFRWNETDSYVPRNQSVIFTGNPAALQRAVNYILSRQADDGRTVLHLTNDPHVRQVVTNTRDKPLVQVALPQWRYVAANHSQFQRFLANWMRFARGVKFDLVLVDDISKLVKPA